MGKKSSLSCNSGCAHWACGSTRAQTSTALWYYAQFAVSKQELPTRLIEPALKYVAQRDLPDNTSGLRAIFQGGREPRVFITFETNVEGVEYVKRSFGGPGARSEHFDAAAFKELKASGYQLFYNPSIWQKRTGVRLFDQESIESGLQITSDAGPGTGRLRYCVFIDDVRNVVLISASTI